MLFGTQKAQASSTSSRISSASMAFEPGVHPVVG
jgi:hypothetical protein